jgi:hypothetical protein
MFGKTDAVNRRFQKTRTDECYSWGQILSQLTNRYDAAVQTLYRSAKEKYIRWYRRCTIRPTKVNGVAVS